MNTPQLPDELHNAVLDGLTLLLALRLPGAPAADTALATAEAWGIALATGRRWEVAQDLPRINKAFQTLAATADKWPPPKALIDALPPPPERLKLEHKHNPTPEQKAVAAKFLKEMKEQLKKTTLFETQWIHGQKHRSVEECKRIYAERQKERK